MMPVVVVSPMAVATVVPSLVNVVPSLADVFHQTPLLKTYFMFLLYVKIYSLSVNLLMTILSFLSFTLLFSVIKDCRPKSILHQGPLKHDLYQLLPSSPIPHLLLLFLVKGLLLNNGINAWVILLPAL
jgi:hypothetical protein